MAAAKKLYALRNLSSPDGLVRPGDEVVQELSEDAVKTLIREDLATYDKDKADSVAAASVAVPPSGTTTGGLEVVEEVIG